MSERVSTLLPPNTCHWLAEANQAADELDVAADFLADAGFAFASQCLRRQGQAMRTIVVSNERGMQPSVTYEHMRQLQQLLSEQIIATFNIPKSLVRP